MQLPRSLPLGRTGTRSLALGASVLALTATSLAANAVPATVFDVTTYGAVANDGIDDYVGIQAAIDAALAFPGDVVIHFPAGQYDIEAAPATMLGSALDLHGTVGGSNPTSVRVESGPGGPAEIVMTPRPGGANVGCIEVTDLQDVTLTGLKIDYRFASGAPATFSQGTVLDLSLGTTGVPSSAWVKLQLDAGYLPPKDTGVRTHAIDPNDMGYRGGVANRGIRQVTPWPSEPGNYRVEHQVIHPSNDNLQIGDLVAFPDFPESNPIVLLEDVDGVTVVDFEINAGAHMGLMVRSSSDTLIDDVRIIPGDAPGVGDPARLISTNRDGIHISDNRGTLEVRDSTAIATDDDGITSHGFGFDMLSLLTSKRIQVTEIFSHQSRLQTGDELRFYNMDTNTYETRAIEVAIVQSTDGHAPDGSDGVDVYLVKLATDLTGVTSTTDLSQVRVANLETVGNNISFTGNDCRLNSGRGIMIWGSNGTIDSNFTDQTRMAGIEVQNNLTAGTWDAACSQGVVISNNTIYRAGGGDETVNTFRGGVIVYNSTWDITTGTWTAQNWESADLYMNITIEDNYFEAVHGPNIIISNATNVIVKNNAFALVNEESVGLPHSSGERDLHLTAVVNLEYVDQIVFSGNDIYQTDAANFRAILGSTNVYVNDTVNCTNVLPVLADQGFVLHP